MTPVLFVAVVLAGGVGAAARHAVDAAFSRGGGGQWPWGVFVVNVSGSFALGVVTGAVSSVEWIWVLGVGLLGGYTTFSAVSVASVLLMGEGRVRAGVANAAGTLVATTAAAALGLWLGAWAISL